MTFAAGANSPRLGNSPRPAPKQSTCPSASPWKSPARKSQSAPVTPSNKQQQQARQGQPGLQTIRSQRNRALLERVANQTVGAGRSPAASQPARDATRPLARPSPSSRRETAQSQVAPTAAVTNSRLRQGALFARRQQLRLTASTSANSPLPPSDRILQSSQRIITNAKPRPSRRPQESERVCKRELLPVSLRHSNSRCEPKRSARETSPAPKGRLSGHAANAQTVASERSKPKTNTFPQNDQNKTNAPTQTFAINQENQPASSEEPNQDQAAPSAAAGSPDSRQKGPSEQEKKIEHSNQIDAGEKMRLESEPNSPNASLISREANNMQRSRSSLGSSRNSLESSSDEQMLLGSPIVSPPPSEPEEQAPEDNKREISPPPSLEAPAGQPGQSKKQKKFVVDIPIRLEPVSDFYELESRPFARGKFAQVKRCVNKITRQCFAAKCIKKRRRLVDIRHEILLEIEALKLSYNTDRIIKLYEVFETSNEIILILEMANGGELQRVLDEEESISEGIVKKMTRQILDALIELHDNDIAHLDIKPQNLLLTEPFPDGDIKLCDFGISRRITKDSEIREICGTPDYVAPEILRYDPISLATDMWSLGVLIYVLLSGYSPFGSDNKQQTFCNITQATLDFPSELFDKNEISGDAIDFIGKLIVRDPTERLTSKQARNHSWLSNE